ncbi:MAG: cbb3-type cytochrome c oxidase subunit I [Armatimonadetes bacterium]|nr:cbb3-type cytochrome c oxidase subunit I [Armatimonadota bacterium]
MTDTVPAGAHPEISFYEEKGRYGGIFSWIFSTNHKRIGILYFVTMMTFFAVAAVLGVLIRLELIAPGKTIMEAQTYNAIYTLHGVLMIFLFVIPGLPAVFGNFFLPIQIGAKDVSFPAINLLSWWLFLAGGILAVVSLFTKGGPIDTGWTFYAPYSIRTETNVSLAVFGVFLIGLSSILTGLNFLTTIHRLRAPGMTWFRMPLFVWSLYATGWIQVLATPIIGITLLLIIFERFLGIGFFDPTKGGDPLLLQHMFWIYSHPAVYIMILPGMGAISEIIPVFSRRTIFGYKAIAMSSLGIAILGYFVWGHHMFTSGMSVTARVVFSFLTFFVAIPTAIKVFNWISTLYKGSIDLASPMLYALSFIFLFSIGGLTGLVLGALAADVHLQDTYFVVGHFHYVMFGGTGFAFFGALHHWFPKMFGKMFDERAAKLAWGTLFVGFMVLYFPMFALGWHGMPRRYYDYLPQFQSDHVISTVGSWILILGLALMAINLLAALWKGKKAEANPWGGTTLEWQIPSPPPPENFEEIPRVDRGPYEFARETV